jgi:hypothetical protein
MSEPEGMPEDVLPVHLNGEPFNVDRWNTSLFTFIGELAEYNHVFIQTGDIEGGATGSFIFENSPPENETFQHIGEFVMEYEFPMHLNMNRVPDCDKDAYNAARLKEAENIEDYVPEWLTDGDT